MAKKKEEPAKLHENFGEARKEVAEVSSAPLLPSYRRNPLPWLIPLILLFGLIGAGVWAYEEYVAPTYSAEQSAYEKTLATAEEYEGEIIKEKKQEENCFVLTFDRGEAIHSLCVSEELWNTQQVGDKFSADLLREQSEDTTIKLPWE